MEDLIELYKPIFYLHSDEDSGPSSITSLLQNCELVNELGQVIIGRRRLTEYNIPSQGVIPEFQLKWYGYPEPPQNPCSAPIYVTYGVYTDDIIWIRYTTFYAYQKPYKPCICGQGCGNHVLDVETVTIYINQDTKQMVKAYLSAHGSTQGMWVDKSDIEFDHDTGRPILYVAHLGHGIYNKPKTYPRIFCLFNDNCDKGIKWNPRSVIILNAQSAIIQYPGKWPNGDNQYINRLFNGENPEPSATCSDRLWKWWKW